MQTIMPTFQLTGASWQLHRSEEIQHKSSQSGACTLPGGRAYLSSPGNAGRTSSLGSTPTTKLQQPGGGGGGGRTLQLVGRGSTPRPGCEGRRPEGYSPQSANLTGSAITAQPAAKSRVSVRAHIVPVAKSRKLPADSRGAHEEVGKRQ